jgi:hypothetical protein
MRTGPTADLSPGRPRPRPFLRTARLNAAGYAALAAACLVAAAVGALALSATGWPLPVRDLVGPVVVVLALVVADRHKWSRMETGFSFTDDGRDMRPIADRLVEQGIPASVDAERGTLSLRYRNGDAKRVHAALAEMGIWGY